MASFEIKTRGATVAAVEFFKIFAVSVTSHSFRGVVKMNFTNITLVFGWFTSFHSSVLLNIHLSFRACSRHRHRQKKHSCDRRAQVCSKCRHLLQLDCNRQTVLPFPSLIASLNPSIYPSHALSCISGAASFQQFDVAPRRHRTRQACHFLFFIVGGGHV